MKIRFLVCAFVVVISRSASAQAARSPDLSVGFSSWRLDSGTASSSANTRASIDLGVGWRIADGLALVTQYNSASQGSIEPGFNLIGAGLRAEGSRSRSVRGFATAVYQWGRFHAENLEGAASNCSSANGCFFEGVGYASGPFQLFSVQVGLDVSFASHLVLEVYGRHNTKTRGPGGNDYEFKHFVSFGAGGAWRP